MANVSRETIGVLARLDIAEVVLKCEDCGFPASSEQTIREGWTIRFSDDLVRCPFCQHLRQRGAKAPLPICLSSPTNLNSVEETTDEEVPF